MDELASGNTGVCGYSCNAPCCDYGADTMSEIVQHSRHDCVCWKVIRQARL